MPKLFDIKLVFEQIPDLLRYLPKTLEITVLSMILGLFIGLLLAIIKINKVPVIYRITAIIVSFLRGTPLLVQLYLTFYGIPIIMRYINYYQGTDFNTDGIPKMLFIMVAFSFNEAAYNSESIRAAILSVDRGQKEAAMSLGMTSFQVLRRIVLPEAFVVALPTLGNTLIGLLKGTSLAFVCSVVEMTARGKIIAGRNYRYFEVYISLALIYWVLTILIEQGVKFIEKKVAIPDVAVVKKPERQAGL